MTGDKKAGALDAMLARGAAVQAYLDQDEYWINRQREKVLIVHMDPEWRYNASRMMERNAARMADLYNWGDLGFLSRFPMGEMAQDGFESAMDSRDHDPAAWIRTTRLYQALVAGLPYKRKKLAQLAERAAHFSTCPRRTGAILAPCRCATIGAAMNRTTS